VRGRTEGRRERRKERRLAVVVVVVVVRSVNLGFAFVRWDFLVCGG
jgi:cytochrome c oxidase assembly protein Cox11